MLSSARTIVVVGGGFSGTVLAANLLRHPPLAPTRLILMERSKQFCCGVAYAPQTHSYVLNVPAARMSASSAEPDDLIEYLRRREPHASGASYVSRQLYGEYLADYLRLAEEAAPPHVRLERVTCEVTSLRPLDRYGPVLVCAGGRQWLADQVVLACGDPPPAVRPYAVEVANHSAYVRDPYRQAIKRSSEKIVFLIGTGPTMVDLAEALAEANPGVQLIAVSRHGLLPASQAEVSRGTQTEARVQFAPASPLSLRGLVAQVRRLIREKQSQGQDWRDTIVQLRSAVPRLWHGLDEAERRRFLRHVRVYWDIHRHRLPPTVAANLRALQASGQLQVRAGWIKGLTSNGAGITVQWIARGQREPQELRVDRVIDCSGPGGRLEQTTDVLLRNLQHTGIATADALGLGLRTASHGALVDSEGVGATQLFYLGPMLRADHWEATAVGELRQHAEGLAAVLKLHGAPGLTHSSSSPTSPLHDAHLAAGA
jgi:uncharacterized NAD(P)/FAD-binding protein YdhS